MVTRRRFLLGSGAAAVALALGWRAGGVVPAEAAPCCGPADLLASAQDPLGTPPRMLAAGERFTLPFATPPGPGTWLLGQAYGNTTGAFAQRRTTYGAGQGIHFGIDLPCPCGTVTTAIGDGVVVAIDGPFGSPPHNVVVDHGNGYRSLYGHLVERTTLVRTGQRVERGQPVGLTGDSQFTCQSAPHLHLEIRNTGMTRAYNPVLLIEADWDSLALAGSFGRGFQRDLDDPRRWQYPDDQPEIGFGGRLINDYANPWPPDRARR